MPLTRLSKIATFTIRPVAIASNEVPTLTERGYWEMMACEARTDGLMRPGSMFLRRAGSGPRGPQAWLAGRATDAGR